MKHDISERSAAMRIMQDHALNYEWDDAILYASHILAHEPNNTVANIVVADALMAREEYNDALPYYQSALREAPRNGHLCYKIAESYLCLEQYDNAARFLSLAIHLLDESAHDVDRDIRANAKDTLESITRRNAPRSKKVFINSLVDKVKRYAANNIK